MLKRLVIILICACCIAIYFARDIYDWLNAEPTLYDTFIVASATRHGVDSLLIRAVIWRESQFNCKARGADSDLGLMQIVRASSVTDWARAHRCELPSEDSLFDPQLNIEIGTWYLSKQLKRYEGKPNPFAMALTAYNAGPGKASQWFSEKNGYKDQENPMVYIQYPSTQKYVKSILKRYAHYYELSKYKPINIVK